ncbi:hypothetical protein C8R44DRAFT_992040 [Mycena epipterygia]|nr:hypothetical protein C8R44DRAFT_992040 [Mycena epipterygia]
MEYHQLGGFNASIYSNPRYPLGAKVYEALRQHQHPQDGGMELELVLGVSPYRKLYDGTHSAGWHGTGIKRSGTSHILLTKGERDAINRTVGTADNLVRAEFNRQKFEDEKEREKAWHALDLLRWKTTRWTAEDFESVSPIILRDLGELEAKLEALRPGGRQSAQWDNSSANKMYRDGLAAGVARGQLENSRVLYRVLQNRISYTKYDLRDISWRSSIRIFSFCYTLWSSDVRALSERRASPMILDIGWCEALTPTLEGDMKDPRHIVIKEHRHLNLKNPSQNEDKQTTQTTQTTHDVNNQFTYTYDSIANGISRKQRYEYGETEICEMRVARERIQAAFGKYAQPAAHPVLLLVHDAETAMAVLKSLAVDVSLWEFGIKNLLRLLDNPPQNTPPRPPQRAGTSRARSQSPTPRPRLPREPEARRRYAPMYVVDLKSLFVAVLKTQTYSESVPAICRRLALFQPKGWCAGNDCWMLVEVFRRMAAGGAIDEQRKEWPEPVKAAWNEEDESDDGGSDDD